SAASVSASRTERYAFRFSLLCVFARNIAVSRKGAKKRKTEGAKELIRQLRYPKTSMKRTFLSLLYVAALGLSTSAQEQPALIPTKPPQKHQIVTAEQANGVYRYYKSEFRILALGHNKLRVEFDGV